MQWIISKIKAFFIFIKNIFYKEKPPVNKTQPFSVNKFTTVTKPIKIIPDPLLDLYTIKSAITAWNGASGRPLFSLDDGNSELNIIASDDMKAEYIGLFTNGKVLIRNSESKNLPLLIHELGHVLGYGHTENTKSYMYPTIFGSGQVFTKEIIELLYKIL